jgi:hypothetical protein
MLAALPQRMFDLGTLKKCFGPLTEGSCSQRNEKSLFNSRGFGYTCK